MCVIPRPFASVVDVDGRPVDAGPHHIIIEDPDGSCTLILDNMTADDSGQYMCFATSSAGNASTLGKVTVQSEWRNMCAVIAQVVIQDYSETRKISRISHKELNKDFFCETSI